MSAAAVTPAYAALLAQFSPRVLRSEEQNERAIEDLYALEQRQPSWSPEEAELAELLSLLIEDFEEKHYRLPRSSPLEAIAFLMEQHGLKQKDLIDVFATASIASEVLRGKRALSKEHIRRLSERFRLSPELFF